MRGRDLGDAGSEVAVSLHDALERFPRAAGYRVGIAELRAT